MKSRYIFTLICSFILNVKVSATNITEADSIMPPNTFKSMVLNDSHKCPIKIAVYFVKQNDFRMELSGRYLGGYYSRLYNGEKVNMNEYPHIIITDSVEIKCLMEEFYNMPLMQKKLSEKQVLRGSLDVVGWRTNVYISKTSVIHRLVILYFHNEQPVVLVNSANVFYYNDYDFDGNNMKIYQQLTQNN